MIIPNKMEVFVGIASSKQRLKPANLHIDSTLQILITTKF